MTLAVGRAAAGRPAAWRRLRDLGGRRGHVLELEGSTTPVLVVAHEGACRTLRAYLNGTGARKEMAVRERLDGSVEMAEESGKLFEYAPKYSGGPLDETVHEIN